MDGLHFKDFKQVLGTSPSAPYAAGSDYCQMLNLISTSTGFRDLTCVCGEWIYG